VGGGGPRPPAASAGRGPRLSVGPASELAGVLRPNPRGLREATVVVGTVWQEKKKVNWKGASERASCRKVRLWLRGRVKEESNPEEGKESAVQPSTPVRAAPESVDAGSGCALQPAGLRVWARAERRPCTAPVCRMSAEDLGARSAKLQAAPFLLAPRATAPGTGGLPCASWLGPKHSGNNHLGPGAQILS
jgi:hypothetical protein